MPPSSCRLSIEALGIRSCLCEKLGARWRRGTDVEQFVVLSDSSVTASTYAPSVAALAAPWFRPMNMLWMLQTERVLGARHMEGVDENS